MAHIHDIHDGDTYFVIDPTTRTIDSASVGKTKLVQWDHNSERFTFEIPRYVEGHDMSLCTAVEIHYVNVANNKKEHYANVYMVDDMKIDDDDENTVLFSWLISQGATRLVGTLSFQIRFVCMTGNAFNYAWHTDICSAIVIAESMYNTEVAVEPHSDVLAYATALLSTAEDHMIDNISMVDNRKLRFSMISGTNYDFEVPQSQANLNQNDRTQPDFVRNRTHYDGRLANDKVRSYVFEKGCTKETIRDDDFFEVGSSYRIYVRTSTGHSDNITYNCKQRIDQPQFTNGFQLLTFDPSDESMINVSNNGASRGHLVFQRDVADSIVYVDVYLLTHGIVKQLDPMFIPIDSDTIVEEDGMLKAKVGSQPQQPQVQADLNQNDETQPDFVKNRTHYDGEDSLLLEHILTPGDDWYVDESGLTSANKTYVIEISTSNGHFHRETFTVPESPPDIGDYHGGWHISTTDPSDDSTISVHDSGSSGETYVERDVADSTVTVKLYAHGFKQLDPKFIPIDSDTIVEENGTLKVNPGKIATKEDIGNIEAALDAIIAIQTSLIGGDS